MDNSAAKSMARELQGVFGHSGNKLRMEFCEVVAVNVGENELDHVVAILTFT